MNNVLKNVLGGVLVASISAGAAVGTSVYMLKKQHAKELYAVDSGYGFDKPVRLTNYPSAAAENIDFTVAAESTVNAVVHIKSVAKWQTSNSPYIDPFELFFGHRGLQRPQQSPQPRIGAGSGVIISADGYIMTNNHVIDGADELEVTLNDTRKFTAKVVGADPMTDIALIKIEAKDLPIIPFGDSEKLKVGEWVLAVGNPFNLTSTVTAGIVSAKGRSISMGNSTIRKIESFIQTDAAVNPGNSGGALVNTKGELIGINTAIYSETGNFAGYSFAVPVSIAGKVASDLKQYGTVQRAMLGISILDVKNLPDDRKEKVKVLEGVYVAGFVPRSSAKEAGVEEGDVIVGINDFKIKSESALLEQISKHRPGDKVQVKVDRNGSSKIYLVELRNNQGTTAVVNSKGDVAEVLGATFKELAPKQKQQLGVSYGIEVTGVSTGKFRDAGITKGYIIMIVNDQKISTPDEFEKMIEQILKQESEDQGLFIKGILPNGRTKYYAINLGE